LQEGAVAYVISLSLLIQDIYDIEITIRT